MGTDEVNEAPPATYEAALDKIATLESAARRYNKLAKDAWKVAAEQRARRLELEQEFAVVQRQMRRPPRVRVVERTITEQVLRNPGFFGRIGDKLDRGFVGIKKPF